MLKKIVVVSIVILLLAMCIPAKTKPVEPNGRIEQLEVRVALLERQLASVKQRLEDFIQGRVFPFPKEPAP